MPADELNAALRRQPFMAFRIHMTDGRSFDVRHPEMCMVTPRTAVVGIRTASGIGVFERTETIALIQVVSLEPLEQPAKSNGEQP